MVYSKLDNLSHYLKSDIYKKVKNFLQQVHKDMPEGKYEIWNDKIFAQVMSYNTSLPEECKIEAHNKYIDIQVTITGAEGISVYERNSLNEGVQYNFEKDVLFFKKENTVVNAYIVNVPGYFTMLYPEDAHRPQERVRDIDKVKKFVIKVAVEII